VLDRWRPIRRAPDATAFVSLYARGRLCGCYGSDEGGPGERLMRAFLRAAHDGRFPPASPLERSALAAQVSYPCRPRLLDPETAVDEIEVGTHGLAFVPSGRAGVLILPHVARDGRLGPRELLSALLRKGAMKEDALREGALYAFETDDVVVRAGTARRPRGAGVAAAAAWLASIVDPDGTVTFAIDPRAQRRLAVGEMHHGRSAVAVQALSAHARHRTVAERAKRRLERDLRAALGGADVNGWPKDDDLVAGTLALAILAGLPLERELQAFVRGRPALRSAWHAAQVAAALGVEAPDALWETCVADLDRNPFAPWTLIAADVRGDRPVRARAARGVARCLRPKAPHRGGASVTSVPQTAVTALAVEALARHPSSWARAAVERGRQFLRGMQLIGDHFAALDPALSHGSFRASPAIDLLRCDVAAHALLALL
jgi:AMMECR1 domain-containing protein